jgi:hypothetical protein
MMMIRCYDNITDELVLQTVGENILTWRSLTRRRDRLVGHVLRPPCIKGLIIWRGLVEGQS